VRGVKGAVVAVALFLGLIQPNFSQKWLESDPDHRIIAVLGFLLILSLLGAYEAEGELETIGKVKLGIRRASATFYSAYQVLKDEERNVLAVDVSMSVRNDGSAPTSAYLQSVEVLRQRFRCWIPLSNKHIHSIYSITPRDAARVARRQTRLSPNERHILNAFEDTVLRVTIFCSLTDDSLDFLRQQLKVRVILDVVGVGFIATEGLLSDVKQEMEATRTPPTDPAHSTPSG
jgi:hypothetical protein